VGLAVASLLATGVGLAVAADGNHISLGPYDEELSCLMAGNRGFEDNGWSDYECVGGPGAWYVEPVPVEPVPWWNTSTGAVILLMGGPALGWVVVFALARLVPVGWAFGSSSGNDPALSGGDGGDSSDGGWSFWGGEGGGSSGDGGGGGGDGGGGS
jgi:hypothetical protein